MAIIHHIHLAHNTSLPPNPQISLGRLYIGEVANVWGGGGARGMGLNNVNGIIMCMNELAGLLAYYEEA